MLGVSGLQRLYLSDHELKSLANKYADQQDPSRVDWKTFETETEEGEAYLKLALL